MGETASKRDGNDTEPLPLDVVYDVLKNQRRRMTIEHLSNDEAPVSIGRLAETIAAKETDTSITELGSQDRKRAYVGLYQCHLPRMADAGIITFDRSTGEVDRGQYFDQVESSLDTLQEDTDGRNRFSLVSIVASVIGLGVAVTTGTMASLPLLVTVTLVGTFAVVIVASILQLADTGDML